MQFYLEMIICDPLIYASLWKRELITLLNLSSWCLVMVERLFLTVPRGCLRFVIVVFPDHTHLLFLLYQTRRKNPIVDKGIRNKENSDVESCLI